MQIVISAVGPAGPDRRSVKVSAAKERCMGSGFIAPEVTSLGSPCGRYRVRARVGEVKAVVSALSVLASGVGDGVQRQHDRFLFRTAVTS